MLCCLLCLTSFSKAKETGYSVFLSDSPLRTLYISHEFLSSYRVELSRFKEDGLFTPIQLNVVANLGISQFALGLSSNHSRILIAAKGCSNCKSRQKDSITKLKTQFGEAKIFDYLFTSIDKASRLCEFEYKICRYFRDGNHQGYMSNENYYFDKWVHGTSGLYLLTQEQQDTTFTENFQLGVFGIGRVDSDIGYLYNTIGELAERFPVKRNKAELVVMDGMQLNLGWFAREFDIYSPFQTCKVKDTNYFSCFLRDFNTGKENLKVNQEFEIQLLE